MERTWNWHLNPREGLGAPRNSLLCERITISEVWCHTRALRTRANEDPVNRYRGAIYFMGGTTGEYSHAYRTEIGRLKRECHSNNKETTKASHCVRNDDYCTTPFL